MIHVKSQQCNPIFRILERLRPQALLYRRASGDERDEELVGELAHDQPVATLGLRSIKCLVGRAQQRCARRAVFREDCHAEGNRDGLEIPATMLHAKVLDLFSQTLRSLTCHVEKSFRQDEDEFLAAVPARRNPLRAFDSAETDPRL